MSEIKSEGVNFFEIMDSVNWAEEIPSDVPRKFRTYTSMYFRADSKKRIFSLDPYKLTDLLGDLGGFLEIVQSVGIFLTVVFVEHSFLKRLIGDAYQV